MNRVALSSAALKRLASMLLTLVSCAAWASPTPHFSSANPQLVYPGSPGFTDSNGRVAVYLSGENLAPNDGITTHPSGWTGGYQHVFVRSVSATSQAGNWVRCVNENGCIVYGGAFTSVIILAFDPARFLSERGSHVQARMWVSMNASGADQPEQAVGADPSAWSNIWTIDAAAPGVMPPKPATSAPRVPTLTKIAPTELFTDDPAANYRIRLYGDFCGDKRVVLFNGDTSAPVTPEETNCRGYDDDGSFLPANVSIIHVTIPDRYRHKAGTVSVAVRHVGGRSNALSMTLKPRFVKATTGGFVPNLGAGAIGPDPNAARATALTKPPVATAVAGPGVPPRPGGAAVASPGFVPGIIGPDNAKVSGPKPGDAGQIDPKKIAVALPVIPVARMTAAAVDYFLPNGQKVRGEMQGNRLFIFLQGKRQAAPDGRYRTADGRFIIVQGGIAQADPGPKDPKGTGADPASLNGMQRSGQGMQQMNQIPVPSAIVPK